MGCCFSKKSVPEVEIKPNIEGNKCFNLKKMLCCDCDDDTCISSCCVIQNITNQIQNEIESKSKSENKSE